MAQSAFNNMSITDKGYVYLRVSDSGQMGSGLQLEAIQQSSFYKQFTQSSPDVQIVADIGTAFNNDYRSRQIFSILENKKIHVFGFDASRFSRNLGGAGEIIELIQRNDNTVYVVGVAEPYVVTKNANIKRFRDEMEEAREESVMRKKRAEDFARARALVKAKQPYQPPPSTPELMLVIKLMIYGCDIQYLYDAINVISPFGKTAERIGEKFVLLNRNREEMAAVASGDFKLKDILNLLNNWGIFEKGKKKWSRTTLHELIGFHFGDEALKIAESNDDVEMEM
jgi:DNA invertase Pin-like site-specific DNA recombinase